jgi:DNA-binding IscR family transcriptional regulator
MFFSLQPANTFWLTSGLSCEECDEKNCAIKGMFETIRDKTLEVLGGTSLHDLNQQ